ncbi:hypothetical protein [Nonomuraea ceibae]|uniref:hypothetical protein n=1 Tax=Nonomuraea ceibae TaxID=1935170 RepID=UPI001FE31012|nr:hypothetical protein [Nonomuraea ceibae]
MTAARGEGKSKGKRRGFDDLIARRDELADVSPPWVDPEPPAAAEVQTPPAGAPLTPPDPDAVPAPYIQPQAAGDLTEHELADLNTCEAALEGLRLAWWAAGKALQTIRDARLYRAEYPSFEAYCASRWDMTRRQADRLIAAWPLAERLRPIGLTTLNEGQVRELLPLADRHGQDAAAVVYQTVAEADGVRVTAAVLKGAAAVVAGAGRFDPVAAAAQIRAYLAGDLKAEPAAPADPVEVFTAEAERLRATISRIRRPAFQSYARTHPEQARAVVAELRALLDDIETAATE